MAARRKKKTARKTTRKRTPRGDIPSTLRGDRVEQALGELNVTKAAFVKAYAATRKTRGVAAPSQDQLASFKRAKGSVSKFMSDAGLEGQSGLIAFGRVARWLEENE